MAINAQRKKGEQKKNRKDKINYHDLLIRNDGHKCSKMGKQLEQRKRGIGERGTKSRIRGQILTQMVNVVASISLVSDSGQ
jgi:hypothetical protein